jgi:serine/threonine protein kinase
LEPVAIIFQNHPGTLEQVFMAKNIPFTVPTILNLVLGMARALESLHGRGYAHRYIKPRNVYINRDASGAFYAVVAGFGGAIKADVEEIARKAFPIYRPDNSSISFIAPEQFLAIRGQLPESDLGAVMKAGDLFSWSAILCKMIKLMPTQ